MQTVLTDFNESRAQRSQDDGGTVPAKQLPSEPLRSLQSARPVFRALAEHQITYFHQVPADECAEKLWSKIGDQA